MKKITIVFTVIFTMTVFSCSSDKLTNDVAIKIIETNFYKDCEQKLNTITFSIRNDYKKVMESLKEAEKLGLVDIKQTTTRDIQGSYINIKAIPTQKAISEYGGKQENSMSGKRAYFKVATVEVVEIIGISINKESNTATVRFTYKLNPTELYNIRWSKYHSQSPDCPKGNIEDEVTFIKYDTGWKMEQPKSELELMLGK